MKLHPHQALFVGFVLSLTLLGGVAWLNWRHAAHMQDAANLVARTHEVQAGLNRLLVLVGDVETGMRGFVVTGEPAFLEPFNWGVVEAPEELRRLGQLVQDAEVRAGLSALEPLIARRIALARRNVDLRREAGFEPARRESLKGDGQAVMEQIRAQLTRMDAREQALLEQRAAAARAEADTARRLTLAGTGLSFALLIAVFALVLRENRLRQQANLALAASEENLAVTLQSIGDAVLATDADGRVTRLNAVAETLTGWTQAEAAGRPVAEIFRIINEQTREPAAIPVAETLASGTVQGLANHTVLIARDGTARPIADSCAPIRGRDGRVLGAVLVFRDVTEQHRQEAAVRASQRELEAAVRANQLIMEHSLDVICTIDELGRFAFVSAACKRIWGYTPEELVGQKYIDLVHPEDHAKTNQAAADIMAGTELRDFENRYIRKDGSLIPVVWSASWSATEKIMFCVAHDVTDRKAAEAALEHERHLLHTLMDHTPADIYFKDRQSRFLRNNRAHARRLGLEDPAQAVGRTDFDFFSPEHATQAFEDEQQIIRTGQPVSKEEKETWPDGRTSWVLTVKLPLRDKSGQIAGTFGISHDITERKNTEAAVQQLNRQLHDRALQLESANKELEAFSYSVSHDLRAPLRHIDGFTAKLSRHLGAERLDDTSRRLLATIAGSARNMGRLIDDLIAFARIGRAGLQRTRVNLDELVTECRRALAIEINGRTVDWQVAPLPAVEGDAALLRQVFANLLGNAVKYTGHRPDARIEIGTQPGAEGEVVVFVRDNGAGFDMQYAGKLFGVFQRLHANTEFEGTGIGLANVRRIIERHGGRIWAEGAVDHGATFRFSLPAARPGTTLLFP